MWQYQNTDELYHGEAWRNAAVLAALAGGQYAAYYAKKRLARR